MISLLEKLATAQKLLEKEHLDGWLLYDFRSNNPLATYFLELKSSSLLTRRFFYLITKNKLYKIVSRVENPLVDLPGESFFYSSWQELKEILAKVLASKKSIAMEYSNLAATPEISYVDAGTIELIKSLGVEVKSSGDLLQFFTAVLNEEQKQTHFQAALFLENVLEKTWGLITAKLQAKELLTEFMVQKFIVEKIGEADFISDHAPICAVNENACNPHYQPSAKNSKIIQQKDLILIDLWCKKNTPSAIYADICHVAIAAKAPTSKQQEIFQIVYEAQQAAIDFIKIKHKQLLPIYGFEVDQIARDIITKKGYGKAFLHRTGHNIFTEVHGPGAHLDNFETEDKRRLLPKTCFSIEPGIYLPQEKIGIRLECNLYLRETGEVFIQGAQNYKIKTLL